MVADLFATESTAMLGTIFLFEKKIKKKKEKRIKNKKYTYSNERTKSAEAVGNRKYKINGENKKRRRGGSLSDQRKATEIVPFVWKRPQ